ncbi:Flp pilus assembly protein CpaB [bacterium]|nr:Flp pilus assembly protein CpaB [bacterium]
MQNKASLIMGVVLGILAIIMVHFYIQGVTRPIFKEKEMVSVLVAAKNINARERISGSTIKESRVPRKFKDPNALTPDDIEIIQGQKTLFLLKKGQQLTWLCLGMDKMEGLSPLIKQKERAVTISVDEVTGVGGHIQPNDHVDIAANFTVESGKSRAGITTLTLLQNVTVLAVGREVGRRRVDAEEAHSTSAMLRRGYNTVTLSLTPQEAEMIIFTQARGKIILVLRNPEDLEVIADMPKITMSSILQLEQVKKLTIQRQDRIKIEVIKGGVKTIERF